MTIKVKRRCAVRIISFFIAAVVVILGYWCVFNNRFSYTKRKLAHSYQAALSELCTGIENMEITLKKSLYTGSTSALSELSGQLALQVGSVSNALSELPIESNDALSISKFVSQAGDFCTVLSKKAQNGAEITEDEKANLKKMLNTANSLSKELNEAEAMYNSLESWENVIKNSISNKAYKNGFYSYITKMEEDLSGYPTLIYDGPFSDHIAIRESELLNSAKEISALKAKEIAAKYLSLKVEDLSDSGTEEGNIKTFVFSFDGGNIAVTKQGGYVSYFRKERDINFSQIDYEKAVAKAREYVNSLNLGTFKETYYATDEGVCVVNFALVQNGITCYTDLIKVGVAMDNGDIMLFEADGYIMNNHSRNITEPEYSKNQAEQKISKNLKVKSSKQVLIPSGGLNELFCYEFYCESLDNEEILVYINSETLAEEDILILLKTEGGTLTK